MTASFVMVLVMFVMFIMFIMFVISPVTIIMIAVMIIMAAMFTAVGFFVVLPVPVFMHKIHLTIARIITMAMFAPVARMAGRYAQIQRFQHLLLTHDNDGLAINDLRCWRIADIDATIKTGLADLYRDGNVTGTNRQGGGK